MRASATEEIPQCVGYAFLYARISADDKKGSRQAEGVRSQLQRLHAECDRWEIPPEMRIEFIDNDITASEFGTKEREDYARLLKYIAASEDCHIFATEQQRIVRQLGEGEAFAKLCIRKEMRMTLLSMGDVDLTSDSGITMWILTLFSGVMESKGISRRSRGKNASMREMGYMRAHGRPAFGYADLLYTEHVPAEVAMLEKLRDMVLAGAGPRECLRAMTDAGFMSPVTGKPFSRPAFRAMLMNPVYAGYVVHKGEIIRESINVQPIFTPDEHQAMRDAWAERSEEYAKKGKPNPNLNTRVHVLAGLVRCGKCGGPLRVGSDDGKRVWRCLSRLDGGCGGIVRSYDLVASVTDECVRDALSAARLAVVQDSAADPERVKLEGEIERLEGRLEALRAEWSDPESNLSPDDYFPAVTSLRDGISTRRARLSGMVRAAERHLPPDALAIWGDDSPKMLATRRQMAATLIDCVVVMPCGNVGRRGAPRDSVQVYLRSGNGTTTGASGSPGGIHAEELAS
jgi:site-specific DNA recombinase